VCCGLCFSPYIWEFSVRLLVSLFISTVVFECWDLRSLPFGVSFISMAMRCSPVRIPPSSLLSFRPGKCIFALYYARLDERLVSSVCTVAKPAHCLVVSRERVSLSQIASILRFSSQCVRFMLVICCGRTVRCDAQHMHFDSLQSDPGSIIAALPLRQGIKERSTEQNHTSAA